jgi:hypothetical protein
VYTSLEQTSSGTLPNNLKSFGDNQTKGPKQDI